MKNKMKSIGISITLIMSLITHTALAQNTFPASGPAIINYDAGAALQIKDWNRFGSTYGGHYPYWGMNVEHTSSGWNSFHPTLRGSLILNFGSKTYFSSVPPNTNNAALTHHMTVDNMNNRIGIGTDAPTTKLDVRNGHAYIGDDAFANPGNWGATLNIDDNAHSRVLIEERATGVKTSLWAHTGGNAKVGTISNHNFGIISNGSEKITVKTNGYVGVGKTNPQHKLDVDGAINAHQLFTSSHMYIGDESFSNPGNWGQTINLEDDVHSRILIEERATGVKTSLWAHTGGNAKVGTISNHNFGIIANGGEKMTITTSGRVGIGMTSPSEKLEVNGTIRSKKVKVEASPWPDYVFEPDFKLRPLSEVETFIQANKHLPEVPSAKEVEANGQDLGEIQATLLKKVEELTLYVIEQNKNQLSMKERLEKLEAENAKLKELLKQK